MAVDPFTTEIGGIAGRLADAYRLRKPIPRLTTDHPALTVEQAYAVQLRQVLQWTTAGRAIGGYKVGLTAAAMQRQFGVHEPDFGHLTDDMFHPESIPIRPDAFLAARIEPEIAFLLGRDLCGPGVTTARAIQAVDSVLPALEIIDSRIADWDITLADTIADNASSGGVVLGSRALRLRDVDVRMTGCVLYRDGTIAETGAGAAALGSPLNALVWLANTLGALGTTLQAGSVVLSGSITSAIPIGPGQSVTAVFHRLGSVTAAFAAQEESAL